MKFRHLRHLAAWLALSAMLLTVFGPLYSRLEALQHVALTRIDLNLLHCGSGQRLESPGGPPEWVRHLDQCGYCSLLVHSPLLPSAEFLPPVVEPGLWRDADPQALQRQRFILPHPPVRAPPIA